MIVDNIFVFILATLYLILSFLCLNNKYKMSKQPHVQSRFHCETEVEAIVLADLIPMKTIQIKA